MDPVEIGSRLELMVDDHLLERFRGDAELNLHHPTPQGRILEMTEPWENGTTHHGYLTVMFDDGRYRMYYAVRRQTFENGERERGPELVCYAESADGIDWERPSLRLFAYDNSYENNIVWTEDASGGVGIHGFSPFKDTNPDCDPDRRYKTLIRGAGGDGLRVLCSPDGIRWEPTGTGPIITEGNFDSQNLAFWDSERMEYRAYWRDGFSAPDVETTPPREGSSESYRGIRTATSPDFRTWSDPEWLSYSDAKVQELYTNQVTPYFRAPHLFVGFPARYVERDWSASIEALPELDRRRDVVEHSRVERLGTALTDSLFMSSRDGVNFDRYNEAFLRPGPGRKENWFYGDNYINRGIVTTPSPVSGAPDELSFYVSEGSRGDRSKAVDKAFRRYTLRLDGFVSVNASHDGGEVVTRPLTFSGESLVVNFSASAAGQLRVEIQDARGHPLDGYELESCVTLLGDDVERTVTWENDRDLSRFDGSPVRLRFRLIDADLFSFRFD